MKWFLNLLCVKAERSAKVKRGPGLVPLRICRCAEPLQGKMRLRGENNSNWLVVGLVSKELAVGLIAEKERFVFKRELRCALLMS